MWFSWSYRNEWLWLEWLTSLACPHAAVVRRRLVNMAISCDCTMYTFLCQLVKFASCFEPPKDVAHAWDVHICFKRNWFNILKQSISLIEHFHLQFIVFSFSVYPLFFSIWVKMNICFWSIVEYLNNIQNANFLRNRNQCEADLCWRSVIWRKQFAWKEVLGLNS